MKDIIFEYNMMV